MAQIFTGGAGRLFFLLKFFYTQIRYANLNFSRAGNSNAGTYVASVHVDYVTISLVSEESRCQSRPGRACVLPLLDGWPRHSV